MKSHCPQGHPYSPENTRSGVVYCVICDREASKRQYLKRKAAGKKQAQTPRECPNCARLIDPTNWKRHLDAHDRGTANPNFARGDRQPSTEERFWSRVNKTDSCWLWTAALNVEGYGRFWVEARDHLPHRWAYEKWVGPIPDDLPLDHLCRVRHCVNPEHLEPVTVAENNRRSRAFRKSQQGKP